MQVYDVGHEYFDIPSEGKQFILDRVREVIKQARSRESHRKTVGGIVGLVAASAKTGKSETLRFLVPHAARQEMPSGKGFEFAYCDVQTISRASLSAFAFSLANILRQQTTLSLSLDHNDPVASHSLGFLLEQHQQNNQQLELFILVDEFHQLLQLDTQVERTDVMRFLKFLSTIPRVHLFLSSTCMLPVLYYCTVLPPNGFSFTDNCELIALPDNIPFASLVEICQVFLAQDRIPLQPEVVATALKSHGLACNIATARFVISLLATDSGESMLRRLHRACQTLLNKIQTEISQECALFLPHVGVDFCRLLRAIASGTPVLTSELLKAIPNGNGNVYSLLYLNLLSGDWTTNDQGFVSQLRGYYSTYILDAVMEDGHLSKNAVIKPCVTQTLLECIVDVRSYVIDTPLLSHPDRGALNAEVRDAILSEFPDLDLSSLMSAQRNNLFRFCWQNDKLTLKSDWEAQWPSEEERFLRFVGQVLGHRFAHCGTSSCNQLMQQMIKRQVELYSKLRRMMQNVHKKIVTFVQSTFSSSPVPTLNEVDDSTSLIDSFFPQ